MRESINQWLIEETVKRLSHVPFERMVVIAKLARVKGWQNFDTNFGNLIEGCTCVGLAGSKIGSVKGPHHEIDCPLCEEFPEIDRLLEVIGE